jgi:hypothetical protein
MSLAALPSPMRMTEPLPNCFSIWPRACASAFLRLSSIILVRFWSPKGEFKDTVDLHSIIS